jgi:hypothetical protein
MKTKEMMRITMKSWFKNDLLKATKEAFVEEFNIKSDKISDNTKSKISFK